MAAYRTAASAFNRFLVEFRLPKTLPIKMVHIVLFISYCYEKGLASSTINTYIAGINFFHKLGGYFDINKTFVVNKLLEGCLRLRKPKDSRLPITMTLLKDICSVLTGICFDQFETKLFKAAYLLAFYGLFRVSELVVSSMAFLDRALLLEDVVVDDNLKHVCVKLHVTKTNQTGAFPTTLRIPQESNAELCPVRAVMAYLECRPNCKGPFFCHANSTPVTRNQFSAVLAKCIRRVRPGCKNIKSHSFRIGRATHLFAMGLSESKIKTIGRWRSDTYRRYIRMHTE